jgi:hypothetical protein
VSRAPRAAAEVVLIYGLLGWIYFAAYAAAYPHDLSVPIAAVVPVRRDTFGALAFAASALAAIILQARTGRVWERRSMPVPSLTRAVLSTVLGYGLLVWVYLCVNSLTHPWTTSMELTHFVSWPSEGSTAVASYAASAVALFLVRCRV